MFLSCQTYGQAVVTYTKHNLQGLKWYNREVITEAIYDEININTIHRYALVKINNKYGCIDLKGNPITPIQYDSGFQLNREKSYRTKIILEKLESQNDLVKMLNRHGRKRSKWQPDGRVDRGYKSYKTMLSKTQHSDRLSLVRKNHKVGAIDENGVEIIPPEYDHLSLFNQGLSCAKKNDSFGVINKKNETVVPFEFDHAAFISEQFIALKLNGVSQMMTLDLQLVSEGAFDFYQVITDELVIIKKNKLYGVHNFRNNKIILPIKYKQVYKLEKPELYVNENEKYGVYTSEGKEVVPPKYDQLLLNNGHYIVRSEKFFGVLDLQGNVVFPVQYAFISISACGHFFVRKDWYTPGFITNSSGEIITKNAYTGITGCDSTFLGVRHDRQYGLLSHTGKPIIPVESSHNIKVKDNATFIPYRKNKKLGAYLIESNKLIPPIYDQITPFKKVGFLVQRGDSLGLISKDGTFLFPLEYKSITPHNQWIVSKKVVSDKRTIYTISQPFLKSPKYTILRYGDYSQLQLDEKIIVEKANYISIFKADSFNIDFKVRISQKCGILNGKGKILVPIKYDDIGTSFEAKDLSIRYFVKKNENWMILAKNKKIQLGKVSKISFAHYNEKSNIAYFKAIKNGKVGVFDENGKSIIPYEFEDELHYTHDDLPQFFVKKDGKKGIISLNNSYIIPALYDDFTIIFIPHPPYEKIGYIVSRDGKKGILSTDGKPLVPFKFDRLMYDSYSKTYGPIFIGFINGTESYYSFNGSPFEL